MARTNNKGRMPVPGDDDHLYGFGGDDTLYGGVGNDHLDGGTGADTMVGGIGDDTYYVDDAGDVVVEDADAGYDTVWSWVSYTLPANVEMLGLLGSAAINGTGNELDNILSGNSGKNILDGGIGDDRLNGNADADTMIGGIGDDTYYVDDAGDVVVENVDEGLDEVYSHISYMLADNVEILVLLDGAAVDGAGNGLDNTLFGNANDNTLIGGDGHDWLNGNAGLDTMLGGLGDDSFNVDAAGDVVIEKIDEGIDTIFSSISYTLVGTQVENLQLAGTAVDGTGNGFDNKLFGNAMSNTLDGGDGNDHLDGGAGLDIMIGGIGDDDYYVDDAGDKVSENAFAGNDRVFATVDYELKMNVEELHLQEGAGAINGTGNGLANALYGNSSGNVLDGGGDADLMSGMGGDDVYLVDDAGDQVIEYANNGTDWVWSEVTFFMFGSEVENLILLTAGDVDGHGNDLDNQIYGTAGINSLHGHDGDDQLHGLGGQDWIWGGDGDDTIDGGTDSNVMHGNADNDTITATGDQSSGYGDEGNDQLFFASNQSSLFGGTGNDTLEVAGDFNFLHGEADNDTLTATGDNNKLDGGAGNDTLEAAAGHVNDIFVFHAGYDQDTIVGFSTAGGDYADLKTFGLADFAQLQSYMSQVGNDVVIALNATDILTLQNVQLASLNASHFDLV